MKIGNMSPGSTLYVSENAVVSSTNPEVPGYFINGFVTGKPGPTGECTIPVEMQPDGRLQATVPAGFSPRSLWITSRSTRPHLPIDL